MRPAALGRIAIKPCCSALFQLLFSSTLLPQSGPDGLFITIHLFFGAGLAWPPFGYADPLSMGVWNAQAYLSLPDIMQPSGRSYLSLPMALTPSTNALSSLSFSILLLL